MNFYKNIYNQQFYNCACLLSYMARYINFLKASDKSLLP